MASGGIGNQSPATIFQARLDTATGVGNTLSLIRYQGNKVVVSGVPVIIPPTGIVLDIADNLINASGADAGAPPAASTLYYVYVSNRSASFAPEEIRLSATAPSLKDGVKYLGLTGNAANWRFVGWVRPNATPQFESSLTSRTIVNYYNRLWSNLFICPNYVDANDNTTYAYNNAVWAEIAAGACTVQYIGNGEDALSYCVSCIPMNDNVATQVGVGRDTVTSPTEQVLGLSGTQGISLDASFVPAEGSRFLSILSAGAQTVFADLARQGADHDTFATFLSAELFI